MPNEQSRGIRAGLDHERARIDRIATGALAIRPELQRRHALIVDELKQHHARVAQLSDALDQARGNEADRLGALACRAWRDLRTRILDVLPSRRRAASSPRPRPTDEGGDAGPTMRCFEGSALGARRRASFDRRA